jgi:3-phosphoshikimate 1-carboxyvinyltransferase
MKTYEITPPINGIVNGVITLNGSKSIANRALIIRALTKDGFDIRNLSNADDTLVLDNLLKSQAKVLDAGAGGTTFRFLTAYLATCEGREVVLTGSERMQERPIRLLVNALRTLGADIEYVKNEGFPPLKIKGKKLKGGKVTIPADTSSQYISALLMVAPTLEEGLVLELKGEIVSLPYILMTLNLMRYFGVESTLEGNIITVKSQTYQSKSFFVEADWSAASYYYSIAFLSNSAEITLNGLQKDSVQGDAVIADIFKDWVETTFLESSIVLKKKNLVLPKVFEFDFLECPDLAQTVLTALAAKNIDGTFQGLKTLLIKETDRVAALDTELSKYGAHLKGEVSENLWKLSSVNFNADLEVIPRIATYEDHRMAMSFAPLSLVTQKVEIEEPHVVTKSYPQFWEDLNSLGFSICEK